MNKKRIIYYSIVLVSMALIGIVIAIIINSKDKEKETKEANDLKEVLILLEENNKSNIKGYEISFNQDFLYEEQEENQDEYVEYSAHYKSNGNFKLSVSNLENKKVNIEDGFKSFFENGNGFITAKQNETHIISNVEIDKNSNDTIREDSYNYSIDNNFLIDSNEDIKVLSETKYIDHNDEDNNFSDEFYGKINKNLLMEAIDTEILNEAVNQLMFIDFWENVNSILKLMHNTFKEINYNDFKAINNFINNKNFKSEKIDNIIKLSFELSIDDSFILTDNYLNNILVNFEFDKNTNEIIYFKFDLANYYSSILDSDLNEGEIVNSKVNDYYFEGKILNHLLEKPNLAPNYQEYNDETKYEFVDDFKLNAIPIRDDLY